MYQPSGRQKAIVAVLPVIDNSKATNLSWELARECTDEIRKRVFESGSIYLLRDHGSSEIARRLNTPNIGQLPVEETKKMGDAQFILVSELINHSETPCGSKPSNPGSPSVLNVAMRIRLIDVRNDQPKVILQEVLTNEYMISGAYAGIDYSKSPWGSEAYMRTPMGIVHNKVVREIVSRVEKYVDVAR